MNITKILCVTPWFPVHAEDHQGSYIFDSIQSMQDFPYEYDILLLQSWKLQSIKTKKAHVNSQKALARTLKNVHLFTGCQYLSIPRYYLRTLANWWQMKRVKAKLERLLKAKKYDLIHVHTEMCAMSIVDIGEKFHVPVLVTLHGIELSERYWKSMRKIVSQTLMHADGVISVGESLVTDLSLFLEKTDHFCVVQNGFRLPLNQKQHRAWAETLELICIANLGDEGKGVDIALQGLALLKKMGNASWHYTIIGDGCFRLKLEMLAESLNIKENVCFKGICSHDKVYELLEQADIFLLPSYSEAFGISYLEAMACGLLTIAVKGQGPQTFIEHEKTGLLLSPKSIDSVVEIMQLVIKEKIRMQEIAKAGRKHVMENFTWQQHANKLSRIYSSLRSG